MDTEDLKRYEIKQYQKKEAYKVHQSKTDSIKAKDQFKPVGKMKGKSITDISKENPPNLFKHLKKSPNVE